MLAEPDLLKNEEFHKNPSLDREASVWREGFRLLIAAI
jgi:hypothetical protein